MGSSNPLLDLLNLQNYQGVMGAPGQGPTFQPQGQTPQTPPLTGIDPTATASNPQGTQLPQNPLPTPGQPGFPDAGPPQAPPGIGHRILQSLQQNPQMLQALGQILMAKAGGKYGGYMAQGAQQQQQRGYENQLQQQQLNQQGQL